MARGRTHTHARPLPHIFFACTRSADQLTDVHSITISSPGRQQQHKHESEMHVLQFTQQVCHFSAGLVFFPAEICRIPLPPILLSSLWDFNWMPLSAKSCKSCCFCCCFFFCSINVLMYLENARSSGDDFVCIRLLDNTHNNEKPRWGKLWVKWGKWDKGTAGKLEANCRRFTITCAWQRHARKTFNSNTNVLLGPTLCVCVCEGVTFTASGHCWCFCPTFPSRDRAAPLVCKGYVFPVPLIYDSAGCYF